MSADIEKLSSGAPGTENITLLAVCPNQDDSSYLRDILQEDHWTVHAAASCDEALRFMRRSSPTVVACDRQLPDGNWKDIFHGVCRLSDPPPLIVVSRHADETLWAEVLNLGGYDVLAKPFEKSEVSRVVKMACRYGRGAMHREIMSAQ
jgi:DNA-binding response OmpR family regulator